MDLDEWYSAGRWVGLIELIDMLPGACRLNEALVNDPEMAALIARQPKPEGEWSPRTSEFGLQEHMLSTVISELKQVKQAVIAGAGGSPSPEKPFPMPRTAVDDAIAEMEHQWAVDFVSQFGFDASDI